MRSSAIPIKAARSELYVCFHSVYISLFNKDLLIIFGIEMSKLHCFDQIEKENIKYRWKCLPGTDVPSATKAIALTESFKRIKQPSWAATSPMTAVQMPIIAIEQTKQRYPLKRPDGLSDPC